MARVHASGRRGADAPRRSAPGARPARIAARRSNSVRPRRPAPSAASAAARWCATAKRCARSAPAPRSSTTSRRCTSAPAAATRARASCSSAGCSSATDDGPWNEWHALFDNGRSGWLSEDNGALRLRVRRDARRRRRARSDCAPASATSSPAAAGPSRPSPGAACWPRRASWCAPPPARAIVVADLRNSADEVGTLDSATPAHGAWSVGRGRGWPTSR